MEATSNSVRQRAIDIELYEERMKSMGENARLRCEITKLKGELRLACKWKKEFKDSLSNVVVQLQKDISLLE